MTFSEESTKIDKRGGRDIFDIESDRIILHASSRIDNRLHDVIRSTEEHDK